MNSKHAEDGPKSLILYGSPIKKGRSHRLVTHRRYQPEYYVRTVVVPGTCEDAFDRARPLEGEVVLNTVPITNPMPPNPYQKRKE